MAGGGGPPVPEGQGGKKTVDFQLNLVPFIDLLSVLISFLLMTAVWTQVAKIDVKQTPNQPSEDDPPPEPEEEKLNLAVLVTSTGYKITARNVEPIEIAMKGEMYDRESLAKELQKIRAAHPDNEDVQVTCEDKVNYQELITVMDVALENNLKGISVAGVDT